LSPVFSFYSLRPFGLAKVCAMPLRANIGAFRRAYLLVFRPM
jgi:hypothetical protein